MGHVSRPDLARLLWLVGREAWRPSSLGAREPLHAVKDGKAYCGYEAEIDLQDVLWVDWSQLTCIDGPEPCPECKKIAPPISSPDSERVVLYSERSGPKDRDLLIYIRSLERKTRESEEYDYRVITARTQFDDGIGCLRQIERTRRPVPLSRK